MLGDFETEDLSSSIYDQEKYTEPDDHIATSSWNDMFAAILFVLFTYLVFVVMLNMLIAQMSESYEQVKKSENVQMMSGRARVLSQIIHAESNNVWRRLLYSIFKSKS